MNSSKLVGYRFQYHVGGFRYEIIIRRLWKQTCLRSGFYFEHNKRRSIPGLKAAAAPKPFYCEEAWSSCRRLPGGGSWSCWCGWQVLLGKPGSFQLWSLTTGHWFTLILPLDLDDILTPFLKSFFVCGLCLPCCSHSYLRILVNTLTLFNTALSILMAGILAAILLLNWANLSRYFTSCKDVESTTMSFKTQCICKYVYNNKF